VVVHDASGHAVENLQKDDFQIKQDGKPQFITHFSVETAGSAEKQVARGEAISLPADSTAYAISDSADGTSGKPGPAPPGALAMPSRFVALLFDDAHLDIGDLSQSKVAALRFIETSVKPNQRLAVYTVSENAYVRGGRRDRSDMRPRSGRRRSGRGTSRPAGGSQNHSGPLGCTPRSKQSD
jgi:VWFA-related protein